MFITSFAEFFLFPGIIFVIYAALTSVWLLRKITARMENRIGPPFNQPLFDFAKIMAKERVYAHQSSQRFVHYLPRFQLILALLMSFFIPIYKDEGLISFEGDVYLFLFLLALHGSSVYFMGWASRNPYALSGSGRALLTEISFELPIAISVAGIAILSKSMKISSMDMASILGDKSSEIGIIFYVLIWISMISTFLICTLGALELNPFSAAHAETEIVAGWKTELTGSDLGLTVLADAINAFNLAALSATLFFGGPNEIIDFGESTLEILLSNGISFILFMIEVIIILFLIAYLKTVLSRLRVDQSTEFLWKYILPISIINLFAIIVAIHLEI
ncbi:MAG: NADH-quinone oxidoreductase subunit H [Candidatus Heimdallarchaeota archaeon]|nr:NADH-quinone oxidoreductase subunit H [Candidatus Heimdallarchaeota archaeon]